MRIYMGRRYRKRRDAARIALGGRCVECGSMENIQFDHKKRRGVNDFKIGEKIAGVAEAKLRDELAKCQLLCWECHNKKTQQELGRKIAKGTHGTLSSHRYCGPPKCEECKQAMRVYKRKWKSERIPSVLG